MHMLRRASTELRMEPLADLGVVASVHRPLKPVFCLVFPAHTVLWRKSSVLRSASGNTHNYVYVDLLSPKQPDEIRMMQK